MKKLILAALFAIVDPLTGALPSAAASDPTPARATWVRACVIAREHDLECKEPFIDQMIALRSKYQPRIKEAVQKDPAGVRAIGLRELAEDGTGPVTAREQKCAAAYDEHAASGAPPRTSDALDACFALSDCTQRLACEMPLLEKLMFGEKESGR
jgi:hypothetical protein